METNSSLAPLPRALLGAALLAAVGHADAAVSISPQGVGQVLLFPYFTINNGNDSYLSITNTTNRGKALKIRFREGRNGRDTLNFNLYLSPYDVWTGAVVSLDANGPANLLTRDSSCSVPAIRTNPSLQQLGDGTRYVPFRNFNYAGSNIDNGGQSLLRTREGSLEVIEMGELGAGPAATQVLEEITQVSASGNPNSGVPANCNAVIADWDNVNGAWGGGSGNRQADIGAPSGGLYGSLQIINVGNGTLHAYDATAIQGFYGGSAAPGGLHTSPAAATPNLTSASNGSATVDSLVLTDDGDSVVSRWTAGTADAVSALLMHESVLNDYDTEAAIAASSEWVLSFPTRHYYTDSTTTALPPFVDPFQDDGHACETTELALFDREMPLRVDTASCDSLCPPVDPAPKFSTCFTTQVLTFAQSIFAVDAQTSTPSRIFGSTAAANITPRANGVSADRGYLRMDFLSTPATNANGRALRSLNGDVYHGLPVLGFEASNYVNGAAQPGKLANYSGSLPHHYNVRIDRAAGTATAEESR